jgi:UPF0755 protein
MQRNEPTTHPNKVDEESTNDTGNTSTLYNSRGKSFTNIARFLVFLFIVSGLVYGIYVFFSSAPSTFPTDQPITIAPGTSVIKIAEQLEQKGVVRSKWLLYSVLVTTYKPQDIKASTYVFAKSMSVYEVAQQLTQGNYNFDLIRFTHREGMSVRVLAGEVERMFPHISATDFAVYATPFEGELFPETYFLPADVTTEKIVDLMRDTFRTRFAEMLSGIPTPALSNQDVITLASILEREANSPESKQAVANILLRRLAIDMPLQVDATMEYVLDKPLSALTPEDLRQDSPYNTYTNFGLPPTPIGNPGEQALRAVLNATTNTPYLFYITGNDGNFYYARNFDEHRVNIARYLR